MSNKINIWKNHPAEITENRIGHKVKYIIIYRDGWKLESGVTGSAYAAYKIDEKNKDMAIATKEGNSV